jgi:hypothetical protein
MSNTVTVTASPWYASSGFWNGVILAASGLVVGFPTEAGQDGVAALFALFASGNAIREALRGKTVDLKAWITNKNTWNYIGATVVAIVPAIPVGLFEKVGELATAALGGNWQGILTALFSIGTMLYFWLKPTTTPGTATNTTR